MRFAVMLLLQCMLHLQRETISVASYGTQGGCSSDMATNPSQEYSAPRSRNLNPSRHLWVGGLVNVTRTKLVEIFSEFGEIEDIHVLRVGCFLDCDAVVQFR